MASSTRRASRRTARKAPAGKKAARHTKAGRKPVARPKQQKQAQLSHAAARRQASRVQGQPGGQRKWVYFFGEGTKEMAALLGGKGANLSEMMRLGLPVPPGFTITTEACIHYATHDRSYPPGLVEELESNVARLEDITGKRLGDPENPLLVSVRSGAKVSMPGMMDTVLNIGLNKETLGGLIAQSGNERFARDCYRRLLQMFGDVVLGVKHAKFEAILADVKTENSASVDKELSPKALKTVAERYLSLIRDETGKEFPHDPQEQLRLAVSAVFGSWNNPRAISYREIHSIPHDSGTAVNIQAMVFGNFGETSGTGVLFTRNPSTGEDALFAEYLMNAQGEDVVAGIRTPLPIESMRKRLPGVYKELYAIAKRVETHYRDMQDMEFTIEGGKLYILQTRSGKRTAQAALRCAVDMVGERLITKEEAVLRISPEQLEKVMHKRIDPRAKIQVIAKGLPASPGAATGEVVFEARRAHDLAKQERRVILVRPETSPEDIEGMHASQGILTSRGGMTSHAAIVARGMGKCCIVGCEHLHISEERREFRAGHHVVKEGEVITIDGGTGEVILGEVPLIDPETSPEFRSVMGWADSFRKLGVRTNADTPADAEKAVGFGAEGIGLCRTEHMFFEKDRIRAIREMIMSSTEAERRAALAKVLPYQRADFVGIFRAMGTRPVTIRLLDPPLHEFLPEEDEEIASIASTLNVTREALRERISMLHEFNPMLGHRGCRLLITYPEICEVQATAILEAAGELLKEGLEVQPEIMIPLVGHVSEFTTLRNLIDITAETVRERTGIHVRYTVGTMIEVPRACAVADEIAKEAEFFSFGTNDLTQMTFGFSRDDINKFLPDYLARGVLSTDPFQTLDQGGVGKLIKLGVELGRTARKDLKIGICGEHGGDPASVRFCHRTGFDYVSCSPYRVPVARLAAAQAALGRE